MEFNENDPKTWTVIAYDSHGRYLIRTGEQSVRLYNAPMDILSSDHSLMYWLSFLSFDSKSQTNDMPDLPLDKIMALMADT